jgi:hypothetical protein
MLTLTDLAEEIAKNSVESGATLIDFITEEIRDDEGKAYFTFLVEDNGPGMSREALKNLNKPPEDGNKEEKFGLGIPFLKSTARDSGGGTRIISSEAPSHLLHGTTVKAWFDLANPLTPPVGEIPELFRSLLLLGGPEDMVMERICEDGKRNIHYVVQKTKVIEDLGELDDPSTQLLLTQYLRSLEDNENP